MIEPYIISYIHTCAPLLHPPAGRYSRLGRAYPDVSMVGSNLLVVLGGRVYFASGTSAAAPIGARRPKPSFRPPRCSIIDYMSLVSRVPN